MAKKELIVVLLFCEHNRLWGLGLILDVLDSSRPSYRGAFNTSHQRITRYKISVHTPSICWFSSFFP
jgi:hypothetical protein